MRTRKATKVFLGLLLLISLNSICHAAASRADELPLVHDSWETVSFGVLHHDSWMNVPLQLPTEKVSTGSRGDLPQPSPGPTPIPGPVEYSPGVEQWRTLVAAYFPAEEVDTALRIMNCESRGDPYAYNPSGASGLFQLMGIWYRGATPLGPFDPFNPELNVAAAAWLWSQSGWAPWVCR